ncbi:amino acid ABC transporter permease [Chthonobacter rhizosphaerae]|uniref:amino acid ABC transporter permease n=1 Tax=Chthonobacter rhizosphaerae TaxID=2735553 RepID=UPI0015EE5599|nr:amino acid ABC transporter permease [Chthonobacter rhizosphaerae]
MPAPVTARPALAALSAVPWWLVAAVLLAVAFGLAIAADEGYAAIFNALSAGIGTTLFVTVVAFLMAALLGLAVAGAMLSGRRIVREAATFYVEIVRGIPVLVLLFYMAFVAAPALVAAWNVVTQPLQAAGLLAPAGVRDFDLLWRAVVALVISYSAFLAEIFRAGIQAVDRGQVEAAKALGLTRVQVFRLVVFPQAIRTVLPPLGNDFVAMIKDSSLVSVLGVQDVTQLGKIYSSGTFLFFETYTVVAYIYLLMTVSLSLAVRALEKRLRRHEALRGG